jgi:hypothetical protein
MFDIFLQLLARTLSVVFVIGMVGCCVVIPLTAFRLLMALFERDSEDELEGK